MGCNNSTPGQVWAHENYGNLPNGNTEKVGQAVLERYLVLENEIAEAEKGSPAMILQHKKAQIEQLDHKIAEQKELVAYYENVTQSQSSTLDDLLENNQSGSDIDDKIRENMANLNNQEIAKKELSNLIESKVNLQNEITELEGRSAGLEQLYEEQESLLNEIFGGAYGSENENRLENLLDQHEQMRNRIVEANFKWKQAQLMIDYAYKQLEHAVKKWLEVLTVDGSDLEGRYMIASETRNNLVAAAQNIQGAQRYLSNVQFPYCAPSEVETLNKATAYIFTDMQTPERHEHALECYSITAKRCGALLQWIHQVVTQTISRDLIDINAKVKEAALNLRRERVALIQAKVKEVLGKDVHLDSDVANVNTDVNVILNLNDLARTEGIDPNELTLTTSQIAALAALNKDEELAPMPSNEEVFGEKLEQLSKELKEDQERLESQAQENQKRVANNLQAKLAARRQRRARKRLEEKEKIAFGGKNVNKKEE